MGTVAADKVLEERLAAATRKAAGEDVSTRAPQETLFHCTAFGKFHRVAVNPTQQMLQGLPAFLSEHPLPSACKLESATVLETSAIPTRATVERMHTKVGEARKAAAGVKTATPDALAGCDTAPRRDVVFVHFGVNAGSTRFELELQAVNEATFTSPDEAGWAPVKARIDADDTLPISHARTTRLPVHQLVDAMSAEGFDVKASDDAGRFVCNWVYYNSLACAQRSGAHALFVHMPPLAAKPMDEQLRFARALLCTIAAALAAA